MAALRDRIDRGQQDVSVESIERYERLVRLIVDNSFNVLNTDDGEKFFHATPSVRESEPDLISDMEEKIAELERTAMSRQYPERLLSTNVGTTSSSALSTSAEVAEISAQNPPSNTNRPLQTPVPAGVTITTTAEVHVDANQPPVDEVIQAASSTPIVNHKEPTVHVVEQDNVITKSKSAAGGVVIDMSGSAAVEKKKSSKVKASNPTVSSPPIQISPDSTPPTNDSFPSANIPPSGSGYDRAVFPTDVDAERNKKSAAAIDELFDQSDDDIPMDAVTNLTQKSKARGDGNDSDESQTSGSQMSEGAAQNFINDGRSTPLEDETPAPQYEDISDDEEEVGQPKSDAESDGEENGNGDRGDHVEREEGGNGSGDGGVSREEEEEVPESAIAANVLVEAMKMNDMPTTSENPPNYVQAFADDGDVQFSRKSAPLKMGPRNGVDPAKVRDPNLVPITTSVIAAAGFHSRDSHAHAMKVRQEAFTRENPLIKDPEEKKQTSITDHIKQKTAHQSTSGFKHPLERQPPSASKHQEPSSSKQANRVNSPSTARQPIPPSQPRPSFSAGQPSQSGSSNGERSPLKRVSPNVPYSFKAPKRPNTSLAFGSKTADLPVVRKDGISKKSKTLTSRMNNKMCPYCFSLFLGKKKCLSPKDHIRTGQCFFIKKNLQESGVNKTCPYCPTEFYYHKGMYEDIIEHFKEKNHLCRCHICGKAHLFSDIFSHISSEILDSFKDGIKCSKCRAVFTSSDLFLTHLDSIHSVRDKNVSIFNKFLFDSHPNYDQLLTALLLTHSQLKI